MFLFFFSFFCFLPHPASLPRRPLLNNRQKQTLDFNGWEGKGKHHQNKRKRKKVVNAGGSGGKENKQKNQTVLLLSMGLCTTEPPHCYCLTCYSLQIPPAVCYFTCVKLALIVSYCSFYFRFFLRPQFFPPFFLVFRF